MVHPYRSFIKSEFWCYNHYLNSFVFMELKGPKCDILRVENKRLRYINGGIGATHKPFGINGIKGGRVS
jgi:hypothetical protein